MNNQTLTLADIRTRQRQLKQEARQDAQDLEAGRLDEAAVTRRSIHRQAEERWLEMEALILEAK